MKPYYDLLEQGVHHEEAWEKAKPAIEKDALYATWRRDFVAGGIGGGHGRFCSMKQIRRVPFQTLTSCKHV